MVWHSRIEAPDHILFDVGGVLSPDIIQEKLADLANNHGLPEPRVQAMGAKLRPAADRGELPEDLFWRAVLESLGVTPGPEDLEYEGYLRIHEQALTLARQLTRLVRVGILSNDTPQMAAARRRLLDLDTDFSPMVISGEVGQIKPEPGIYLTALKAAGCPAERCLFIDDRPENVQGARKVGMLAILYRGVEDLHRRLREEYALTLEEH